MKNNQENLINIEEQSISSYLYSLEDIASRYEKESLPIPFGSENLSFLEKKMNGGLLGGRLYLLGEVPSPAKSILVNNICDNICLNGYPVLFFSYDDGRSELLYRTFARFSGYNIHAFYNNSVQRQEIEKIWNDQNIQKIINLKYVVQEMIAIEKWDQLITRIKAKHNKGPVIFIDYLRKLNTEKDVSVERTRVDIITSKLTDLAKTHDVPVFAISEVARLSYQSGKQLGIASLKESGALEYEASWLAILAPLKGDGKFCKPTHEWDIDGEQKENITLLVLKAKRGTGVTGRIPLNIDKNKMSVTDRKEEPASLPKQSQKNDSITAENYLGGLY